MSERFAIYYAPAQDSALWALSAQWLGRDAAGREVDHNVGAIARDRLDTLTGSARRYGFHATLKAPMGLAGGHTATELEAALAAFAKRQRRVASGPLVLRSIDGFLALVPQEQSDELTQFAAEVVEAFEPFRAPLSEADRMRRLKAGLSARQSQLLASHGYPYVFEQFLFHMTLTDRLPVEVHGEMMAAASDWFASAIGEPLVIDRLVLFHEAEAGAPFMRLRDFVFLEI